jgi:hypothetical protein
LFLLHRVRRTADPTRADDIIQESLVFACVCYFLVHRSYSLLLVAPKAGARAAAAFRPEAEPDVGILKIYGATHRAKWRDCRRDPVEPLGDMESGVNWLRAAGRTGTDHVRASIRLGHVDTTQLLTATASDRIVLPTVSMLTVG